MPILFVLLLALLIVILIAIAVSFIRTFLQKTSLTAIKDLIRDRQYKKAMPALNRLIESNQNNYVAHKLLADVYRLTKNVKMAIVEYRMAERGISKTSLADENEVRNHLANLLEENKNFKQALEERLLLIKNDAGTYIDNVYRIGMLYKKLRDIKKAIQYLTKASRVSETAAQSFYELGLLEYENNNFDDTITWLTKCLDLDKSNLHCIYYTGLCYRHTKNYSIALKFLEQAEGIRELKANVFLNKGICYIHLGQRTAAFEHLKNSLSLNKARDQVYLYANYYLAFLHEAEGKLMQAIDYWESINEVNAHFKDVPLKLKTYQEIRMSDYLKDFLTCNQSEYQEMCTQIIAYHNCNIQSIEHTSSDVCIYLVKDSNTKLRIGSDKFLFKLFVFNRVNRTITDDIFRSLLEQAKTKRCLEVYYFTMASVTSIAQDFIRTRPVKLFTGSIINKIFNELETRKEI